MYIISYPCFLKSASKKMQAIMFIMAFTKRHLFMNAIVAVIIDHHVWRMVYCKAYAGSRAQVAHSELKARRRSKYSPKASKPLAVWRIVSIRDICCSVSCLMWSACKRNQQSVRYGFMTEHRYINSCSKFSIYLVP